MLIQILSQQGIVTLTNMSEEEATHVSGSHLIFGPVNDRYIVEEQDLVSIKECISEVSPHTVYVTEVV